MRIDIKKLYEKETPYYLYDLELLEETLKSIKEETKDHPEYHVHYAIKANANPLLLNVIREYGLGIDCVSGGEITVAYERNGEKYTTSLVPKLTVLEEDGISESRYLLGIVNSEFVELKGFDGIKYAWYEMLYNIKITYKSLGMLVRGKVSRQDVAGPVGIAVNVVGKSYEATKSYGGLIVLMQMLNITLMLSVNLGILNLLPLPALDGGRLVFLFLEVIRGKPVSPEKEGLVHFIGLMFFMLLMVFVFVNDLTNVFAH